jgi:hypothetical protein
MNENILISSIESNYQKDLKIFEHNIKRNYYKYRTISFFFKMILFCLISFLVFSFFYFTYFIYSTSFLCLFFVLGGYNELFKHDNYILLINNYLKIFNISFHTKKLKLIKLKKNLLKRVKNFDNFNEE